MKSRRSSGSSELDSGGEIKVVKGRKLERRRRAKIALGAAAFIALAAVVLNFALPAGLVENAANLASVMGSGSYPIELSGSDTLNTVSSGSYYYALTDTSLSAYSNAGKNILSVAHGFSRPVLKTSETRALIFDQGGSGVKLLTVGGVSIVPEIKNEVINAAISRSGAFAIATTSDSYASSVTVYSKNGEEVYTWNSAKDTVSGVALAPSGKKLAVVTINAAAGQLNSKVSVLEFDSADPVFSLDIPGEAVLSLEAYKSSFCVLTSSKVSFIEWSKYKKTDITSSLSLDMFRSSSAGSVLVFNRPSDKSDNYITVLSRKGEKLSEFTFSGIISDIAFAKGHIYCISDNKLYLFDRDGKQLRCTNCSYGARRLAVLGAESVAVLTDSSLEKIEIKE